MKKLLILTLPMIALVGCVTPLTNYQATVKNISEPPIGSVNVANLGDKLLTQGNMVEREALYFPNLQKMGLGRTVQSGYYPKQGESEQYIQYSVSSENGAGKIIDGAFNDPSQGLALRKADNAICAFTVYNMMVDCKTGLNYEKKNWGTANSDSFQQTLIYNGKVGNKINIGYREFSSNLARPAFNNDVEYDLSQSKEIGYKGALLEIQDANNQQIKYKVIKNFNTN